MKNENYTPWDSSRHDSAAQHSNNSPRLVTDGGTAAADAGDDTDDLMIDAVAALTQAKAEIAPLDPVNNDDDVMPETKAVTEWKNELGKLIADGLDEADANAQCGQLSAVSTYTKKQLWDKVETAAEKQEQSRNTKRPFDEVIKNDVIEVVRVKSTDAYQNTIYRWRFTDGEVVTKNSKDDTNSHFSWPNFRDDYFDVTQEMPSPPNRSDSEAWREFIAGTLDEKSRTETSKGARTCAFDELRGYIEMCTGYAKPGDALQNDGVHIDDDPEDGSPSEIWVPNQQIKRICDNNELSSMRGLQVELDARNLTSSKVVGASHTTRVNGRLTTFWRLNASIATPDTYIVEPERPVDAVRERTAERAEKAETPGLGDEDGGERIDGLYSDEHDAGCSDFDAGAAGVDTDDDTGSDGVDESGDDGAGEVDASGDSDRDSGSEPAGDDAQSESDDEGGDDADSDDASADEGGCTDAQEDVSESDSDAARVLVARELRTQLDGPFEKIRVASLKGSLNHSVSPEQIDTILAEFVDEGTLSQNDSGDIGTGIGSMDALKDIAEAKNGGDGE